MFDKVHDFFFFLIFNFYFLSIQFSDRRDRYLSFRAKVYKPYLLAVVFCLDEMVGKTNKKKPYFDYLQTCSIISYDTLQGTRINHILNTTRTRHTAREKQIDWLIKPAVGRVDVHPPPS